MVRPACPTFDVTKRGSCDIVFQDTAFRHARSRRCTSPLQGRTQRRLRHSFPSGSPSRGCNCPCALLRGVWSVAVHHQERSPGSHPPLPSNGLSSPTDLFHDIVSLCSQMPLGQRPPRVYEVSPKSQLSYAFDVPAAHSKSITVWSPAQPNMRREVGIMEIGPQRPIEILVSSRRIQSIVLV